MLNIDTVKTLTLYSKKQVEQLANEWKTKLNAVYQSTSTDSIQDVIIYLKLYHLLIEVPSFAQQSNYMGERTMIATLQILFAKCSFWKAQQKQQCILWVSTLLQDYSKYITGYKIKQQMMMSQPVFLDGIQFFNQAFHNFTSSLESLSVLVSFFRVYILNQLQEKRILFKFQQNNQLAQKWKKIQQNLINVCREVDSIKKEEIAVSISYWLCTSDNKFIPQCVKGGIIAFLRRSLLKHNITELYGKKIINFLKILMISTSHQYYSHQFQNSLAKFSYQFDNSTVFNLISDFLRVLNFQDIDKMQVLKVLYSKYSQDKSDQNIKKLLNCLRILLLYGKADRVVQTISKIENIEYLTSILKNQKDLMIIKQLCLLLSNHCQNSQQKNTTQLMKIMINKISSILQSNDKSLVSENKKNLIDLCKTLKHLLSRKQLPIKQLIVQNQIENKLMKYSDAKVLLFQRNLFQFRTMLHEDDPKNIDTKYIIDALSKFLLVSIAKSHIEEDLQQAITFYNIIIKDSSKLQKKVVEAILNKIQQYGDENKKISIFMLDNSDSQNIRHHKDQINYYIIKSLYQLSALPNYKYILKDSLTLKKIQQVGISSYEKDLVKICGEYVQLYLHENQIQIEDQQPFIELCHKLSANDLPEVSNNIISKLRKQIKNKEPTEILNSYLKKAANLQNITDLQKDQVALVISQINKQDSFNIITTIEQYMSNQTTISDSNKSTNSTSFHYYLQILYRLSQKTENHSNIFQKLSKLLKQYYILCKGTLKNSNDTINRSNVNLLYLIFTQILQSSTQEEKNTYYKQIMQQSLDDISFESLKFTEQCLTWLPYQKTQNRNAIYMRFIHRQPQLMGREAALIITKSTLEEQILFWIKFRNSLNQQLQKNNINSLRFLEIYVKNYTHQIWDKYSLYQTIQILYNNFYLHANQIKNSTKLTSSMLHQLKISSNIFYLVNYNSLIDISNLYSYQNQHFIECIGILTECINQKTYFTYQLSPIVLNLIMTLIICYRRHEGGIILLKSLHKLSLLFKNIYIMKNKQLNGKCLEIIKIGMLKDIELSNYSSLKRMYDNYLQNSLNSQYSKEKEEITIIINLIEEKDIEGLRNLSLSYFFGDQNLNLGQLNDQELLRYLKNLLHPPYKYGINQLITKLRKIPTYQYGNCLIKIFVRSQFLHREDNFKTTLNISQIQTIIVKNISEDHSDLSQEFYQMIQMNKIGLSLCLTKKGIGQRGVTILANKIIKHHNHVHDHADDHDYFVMCINILFQNVKSQKELQILYSLKVPQIVTKIYNQKSNQQQYARALGNFIGFTSKHKAIQQSYDVIATALINLNKYQNDPFSLSCTMYAISGLVYLNQGNQTKLANVQSIKLILKLILTNIKNYLVVEKGTNLLSNLIYKNKYLRKIYSQLNVAKSIVTVLNEYRQENDYPHNSLKQCLRLIGNLSIQFQTSYKLSQLQFMSIVKYLVSKATQNHQYDLINLSIDIIYNMVNFPELEVRSIALRLFEEGYLQTVFQILKTHILNPKIVESCLDSYQCLCSIDVIRELSHKENVYSLMKEIQKTQEWNEDIVDKWMRIIYKLSKQNQYDIKAMLDSAVLSSACNFLKSHSLLRPQTIQAIIGLVSKIIKAKCEDKYHKSGFIDFLIQLIKIKNIGSTNVNYIVDLIIELNDLKQLNSQYYSRLFEAMIKRLLQEYRDQSATKILTFIKKIKSKVIINSKSSAVLYQFSYLFLTQKQIITSESYHKRVREFISLLSYFISFNTELRLIFKEQIFISVLRNWMKIDSLILDDNSITESCRLCLFGIYNEQKLLVNIDESIDLVGIQKNVKNGYKCLLYRKDKTNKNAIIQLNQKRQIIAFKHPNGEIKQKYSIPTLSTVNLRHTYNEKDEIYKDSIFYEAGNVFHKDPILQNCISIFGLEGENLSIRQINVEFQSVDAKKSFVNSIKAMVSSDFKKTESSF